MNKNTTSKHAGDSDKSRGRIVRETVDAKRYIASLEPVRSDDELAYSGRTAANVYEGISDLYDLGLVDKVTMDRFDASGLTPVAELSAPDIKALRDREKVSQSVFAKYLGIAVNTLSQWERGARRPDGPALKLLSLIDRHGLEYIR